MLAVKRRNSATARVILEFGIDPGVQLLRDADWSTPLHVAVQNADTVLAEVLLKYGPTQLLYAENSVGQTPLDIASLKGLPRETGPIGLPRLNNLVMNIEYHLSIPQKAPPFEIEKQRIEIPKLRAMLDTLLATGRLVNDAKLTTELLAFAGRMEERLVIEDCAEDCNRGGKAGSHRATGLHPRPGMRQLVHLADMQRSVQRNLARKTEGTPVRWSERSLVTGEEDEETDPEKQRIAELKAQSLFASGSESISDPKHVDLYGEDKL
ncbi:hypothetical protein EDB84DRAFT_1584722 [Lactarius hengduanensis]|nr:hypothetical protein EDB84DRAFT_1584722 [Lactarius hengduanensis]